MEQSYGSSGADKYKLGHHPTFHFLCFYSFEVHPPNRLFLTILAFLKNEKKWTFSQLLEIVFSFNIKSIFQGVLQR